jgi:probable DNA repair protein
VFDPPAYRLTANGRDAWHVSLGPALAEWPLVADALLLLGIEPHRLTQASANRLLNSPWLAGGENHARTESVRRLIERAPYEITAGEWAREAEAAGASRFAARIRQWQALRADHRGPARPSDWIARFQAELEALGFGRGRRLDSREYQALDRWHDLMESFATLDAVEDGSLERGAAFALLAGRARAIRFRERDPGCPVEVLGVEEALGSRFDAVWITTLDQDTWPKPARRDPLIPGPIQAGVPASTGDGRLDRARAELAGLLRTAPELRGSLSIGSDEQPREPTPLLAGVEPKPIEPAAPPEPVTLETIEHDVRAPALDELGVGGGTGVLRDQSACAFRAFAVHRLAAAHLQPPRPGVDAAARGRLIHRALELFWDGLEGRAELLATTEANVAARIERAAGSAVDEFVRPFRHRLGDGARMLEQRCTARALARWLAIERVREDFRVVDRERAVEMTFGALKLTGKIDRIDATAAGTVLIDYKTGRASKSGWRPDPRIADPQLPAYALALDAPPAGIAFARLALDAMGFDGLAETDPGMPGVAALDEARRGWKDFDDWQALLAAWRARLEALAAAFVDGRAEVDPRDPQACRYCDLHALCRIDERQPVGRWLADGE